MKRTTVINDILKPLSERKSQAYISNALQVADILEWLLSSPDPTNPPGHGQQVAHGGMPPCKKTPVFPTIYQTTFSISEEFLRRIYFVKKRHPAKFVVIIDRKALQKTIQLWKFISRVYDEVYISDNHSKILLVDYGTGKQASVVTSQNLTRGNRAESAIVSSDPFIYSSLKNDFDDLRINNSAPMHEIMPIPNSTEGVPSEGTGNYLEEIERLAGYFVPISDIAVILGINESDLRDLIADPSSRESLAYRRGKAKSKVAIKAQEMEFAKTGSPFGMQSVRENLILMENEED